MGGLINRWHKHADSDWLAFTKPTLDKFVLPATFLPLYL